MNECVFHGSSVGNIAIDMLASKADVHFASRLDASEIDIAED